MLSLPKIILITTKSILVGDFYFINRNIKKEIWVETEILITKTIILLIKLPTLNEMDL